MPRKNVTLSVDADMYDALSEDYKISRLVDIMMESYLSDDTQDITLTMRMNQITAVIEELTNTVRSAEKTIEETNARINFLNERRAKIKEDFQHAKDLRVRSDYYNQFNGICINADFDLPTILERGSVLIEKIKLVDPTFNPKARMERYKILLDEI